MSQRGVFSYTSQVLEGGHGTGTADLTTVAAGQNNKGTGNLPATFDDNNGPFMQVNNKANPQGPTTKCQLHVDVVAPTTTAPDPGITNAALAEMVRIAASEEVNGNNADSTNRGSTVKSVYVRVEFASF